MFKSNCYGWIKWVDAEGKLLKTVGDERFKGSRGVCWKIFGESVVLEGNSSVNLFPEKVDPGEREV